MSIAHLISDMSEDVYLRLSEAVASGRWADGKPLDPGQRDQMQQLVLAWQARHLDQPQHLQINRSGNIEHWSKQQLKNQFRDEQPELGEIIATQSLAASE